MVRPKIIRKNFGWFKRKHGILLDPLPPVYKKLLIDNKFIRDIAEDLPAMDVVFKVVEMEQQNKHYQAWWPNHYRDEITTYEEIVKDSKLVDWNCAICDVVIKSSIEDFKPKNFCCTECQEVYCESVADRVDERIVTNSIKFTLHCKKLFKIEMKDFMKYAKRNNKKK